MRYAKRWMDSNVTERIELSISSGTRSMCCDGKNPGKKYNITYFPSVTTSN